MPLMIVFLKASLLKFLTWVSDLEIKSESCNQMNAPIDSNKTLSILDNRLDQLLTECLGSLSNQLLAIPGSPFQF